MVDFSDPERWQLHKEAVDQACADFKAGAITQAVFAAKLHARGYLPHEIQTEINLNWPTCARHT